MAQVWKLPAAIDVRTDPGAFGPAMEIAAANAEVAPKRARAGNCKDLNMEPERCHSGGSVSMKGRSLRKNGSCSDEGHGRTPEQPPSSRFVRGFCTAHSMLLIHD